MLFDGWQYTTGGILNIYVQIISVPPKNLYTAYGIDHAKDGVFSMFTGLLSNAKLKIIN